MKDGLRSEVAGGIIGDEGISGEPGRIEAPGGMNDGGGNLGGIEGNDGVLKG